MTAQRLVRGGKARIVLGVCGVFVVVAAIFHHENVVSEFETLKKRFETCSQQSESLSVNLQVIVDYKNKLEKTLQQEKQEHKQTRIELEARVNDEKLRRDKTSVEANLRFTSLQQHYKLLQAKHDDLKLKSDKQQEDHMEEKEQLESRIKELQEQLKRAETDKVKSLEQLKHGRNIFDANSVHEAQKENNEVPDIPLKNVEQTTKNFAKQVEVAHNVYQIQDQNNIPIPTAEEKNDDALNAQQIDTPKLNNSVDNPENNIDSNVLQKPNNNNKSSTKTNSNVMLPGVQPLKNPTATPETKKENEQDSNVISSPIKKIKLPEGVVPIPEENVDNKDKARHEKNDDKNIPDEIDLALPNRYRNNILDTEIQNELNKETKAENKPKMPMIPQRELPMIPQREPELNQDINQDNNAMEVMDQPKALGQENQIDNQNMESNDIKMQENEPKDTVQDKRKKAHIDTLGERQNDGVLRAPVAGGQYEGEGDYDKDGHKEDLQIEEQEPEGEEDGKGVNA